MKTKTLIITLVFAFLGRAQSQSEFFDRADVFFKMYTQNGRVNYTALRQDPTPLNWLTTYLATETIDKRTEKAYLINAYNIFVIDQIVKQPELPRKPTDVSGFFDKKVLILAENKISLNQLENELIRPVYNDPRVHFVLVCAGLGCPPIASYAFRPEKLDLQLDYQTKLALNDANFVYDNPTKKKIYLSQIFEWYQVDFGGSTQASISYINPYRETPFNPNFTVNYYPYDWTLNKGEFEIIPVELESKKELPVKDGIYDPKAIKTGDNGPETGLPPENDKQAKPEANDVPQKVEDTTLIVEIPIPAVNLQTFTAGSLLAQGKFDFTLFNTLYTENRQNWQGQNFSGYRATFVTHLFQVTYGLTASKRINVGLDINLKNSGRSANDASYGAISRAFAYTNNDSARVGISSVGARLKIQPFKTVQNFTIQTTLYIPTIKHPEGYLDPAGENNLFWADWDRITWWNQLFLDKTFGKFQLFTELDFLFRFKRYESQIGMLDMPASVFLSYFPTKRITIYAMTQHVARFTNNINGHVPVVADWVIPMNYTASGLGFKYQLLPNLNLELLYTNFWRGQNTGLGETVNLGIKFLTH